ncbi:hypothetical protein PH586_09815 [Pseudomonas sp. SA3-5]|uniref:Uncharacterized protein n=1 Tax=Pseudomonas aestuarii TaxID=3018340 RepID=A0ABT4XEP0_9PSED|nr:hypothetical protein [Pseudomonas aestuarii]MDA7086674.1 hypothetical protein [Pseudomonas aestuarii]
MTEHAGEVEQGLLWKQEHLAPMPIPTGQPASDLMNIIWRKNEVYLDIGSFAMAAGWLTLHCLTVMFAGIAVGIALTGDYWLSLAILGVTGGGVMVPLWYFFIKQWRNPLTPPIRFNRQRREVCITEPDSSYWFVPWERVYAIAPSVTNLGTYGATKHGSLLLWFPLKGQEHETYGPDKKGWVLMVNPGGGISSMAQWECIRSFMEVGPDAVPDSSHAERSSKVEQQGYLGVWWGLFGQLFDELKAKEYGAAFSTLTGLTIFGAPWIVVLLTKKLANLPDLTAPEVVEWSKPLPPAQWAKRSPELERAIAEREAELAAQ